MLKHRVIPCLLLQNGGLYKTTKFSNPKYVGDPINAIRIFNDKEADELLLLDIRASKEGRDPDYKLIEQIAGECFMPLCYGGGVRSVEQASQLFSLGIEKICIQTAALLDFSIISQISERFGNQSVVFSLDLKKNWLGKYQVYSAASRSTINLPWIDALQQAVCSGAGEIILNIVDRDGTMRGMDCDIIGKAAKVASVPLIALGGASSLFDIRSAFNAGASAVAAGAFFVFYGTHRAVLITYPSYQELEGLYNDC
jgi:cyclase